VKEELLMKIKITVLSIFIIILFAFCKSPVSPRAFEKPFEEEIIPLSSMPKVIFAFVGKITKIQGGVIGAYSESCHIKGYMKNTGKVIAYHCEGKPKAYADTNKTIEIGVTNHGSWLWNKSIKPGEKEYFDFPTINPDYCPCADIKVFEIIMEYNPEYDKWGDPKKVQILTYVFDK